MAWPLLGSLYAAAPAIGGATAVLAAVCIVAIVRLADDRLLRPLVPVSLLAGTIVIMSREAWGVGVFLLVFLPLVCATFNTMVLRRITAQNS